MQRITPYTDLPVIVTRSDKKGLIAHDRKSNFFTQIQSYMNALLDFSVRHSL